jgi:hypothetical protein
MSEKIVQLNEEVREARGSAPDPIRTNFRSSIPLKFA